jgi:hypothetical protein
MPSLFLLAHPLLPSVSVIVTRAARHHHWIMDQIMDHRLIVIGERSGTRATVQRQADVIASQVSQALIVRMQVHSGGADGTDFSVHLK